MASTIERLDFEISGKADQFTRAVDQASGKLDTLVAKAQTSAQKVQSSNAGMADSYFHVVDRLKVAAAAVESLGAKTDALTGKQNTAWTALGAVVGGTTATMIERVTKFADAAQKASDGAASGFQSMATSLWASTDALRVANDQIEIANAKLEGKRPNNLALQLDEARVMADKLATSLDSDDQKIGAVLSRNHQSWWHTLLHQGTTSNLEGTVTSMTQQISDAGNQQQIDLHAGSSAAAAKDRKSIDSGLAYLAQKMAATVAEIDRDAVAHKGPDRKVERSEAVGVLAQVSARQDDLKAQDQSVIDKDTNRKLTDAKEAQQKAEEAARRAAELARAAAEANYRALELAREQEIQAGKLGAAADKAFWDAHIGETTKGSVQYLAIRKKIDEDDQKLALSGQQYREEQARGAESGSRNALALTQAGALLDFVSHRTDKLTEDTRIAAAQTEEYTGKLAALRQELSDLNKDPKLTPEDKQVRGLALQNQIGDLKGQRATQLVQNQVQETGDAEEAIHRIQEQANAYAELTEANEKNAASLAQLIVAHEAETGAISRNAEAMRLATIHQAEYAAQTAKLNQQKADIQADTTLTDQQKQLATTKVDTLLATVGGDAERTAIQDRWNEFNTTALGGGIEALQKFEAAADDISSQIGKLTGGSLKGFNETLLNGLATPHQTGRDWSRDFHNLGSSVVRNVAGMGLEKVEGMGVGALGKLFPSLGLGSKGKPTGAAGDPLHVILAGGIGSVATGGADALSGISSLFSKTASDGSGSQGVGSMLGKGVSAILSFIPGFADGTSPLSEDTLAWVGERGPELRYLGKGTGIVPNHKTAGVGGFTHTGDVHVHIPPGANDPGAIHAAVRSGYNAAVRDSQAAMAHGQMEKSRRTPGLARG